MPFDIRTHIIQNRGGRQVLTSVNPNVRLKHGDDPPVFIQGGRFYSEDGAEYDEATIPGWVEEEVRKLTPQVRKEVGLEAPTREEVGMAKEALRQEQRLDGVGQPDADPGPIVSQGAMDVATEGGKDVAQQEPATRTVRTRSEKVQAPKKPYMGAHQGDSASDQPSASVQRERRDDSPGAKAERAKEPKPAPGTTPTGSGTRGTGRKAKPAAERISDEELLRALNDEPDDPDADAKR